MNYSGSVKHVTVVIPSQVQKNICYILCMQHNNEEIHNLYVFAGHLALLVNHVIQKGTYYVKAMYIGL